MNVNFENAMVMNVRKVKTRNDTDMAILKFLDVNSGEDYKIFCFGDSFGQAAFLSPMTYYTLEFGLYGQDDGGVRLVLEDARPL